MTNTMEHRVLIFSTHKELSYLAASHVQALSAQAIRARGRFTMALSGGSLPKLLALSLTKAPIRDIIDWSAWHIFWADERCVPLTDPDSNYRLAQEQIFNQVKIPPAQIYAINDTLKPETIATAYQATLAQVLQPAPGEYPRFDLILLGLGEDGHTASLFPDHPLLKETERWVLPIFDSPKPPPERITLSLPVINNAHHVAFLATGAGKADILSQILEPQPTASLPPAGRIQPDDGQLTWFLDDQAAAKLTGQYVANS